MTELVEVQRDDMARELHLFIVWENAKYESVRIFDDINCRFDIVEVLSIKWDMDNFSSNISRFYGEKLPSGSFKEVECGTGSFTLITVIDQQAAYENRDTTKGLQRVNSKMFDAKSLYRQWTGGGHKIHATNSPAETKHDLVLLLGERYDDYINTPCLEKIIEKSIEKNLLGCIQWSSMQELFNVLNESIDYVVLRNFEGMPEQYYQDSHGDIDILVKDYQEAIHLLNAKKIFHEKDRVHFKVNINYQSVRFDIRFVGDDYYDRKWQQKIIENRVFQNGIYVPSADDHKYSLLYHALVHKKQIAEDYRDKLAVFGFKPPELLDRLNNFMLAQTYTFTEPKDLSVFFNNKVIGQSISVRRRAHQTKLILIAFIKTKLGSKLTRRIKNAFSKSF